MPRSLANACGCSPDDGFCLLTVGAWTLFGRRAKLLVPVFTLFSYLLPFVQYALFLFGGGAAGSAGGRTLDPGTCGGPWALYSAWKGPAAA